MKKHTIANFKEYLDVIDEFVDEEESIILYRGQSEKRPLLPSVARLNKRFDTTDVEKEMLSELKRKTNFLISKEFRTDWEWLVYAQHFGMKTRLLDWTTNPLTALWFACSNQYVAEKRSYVYLFLGSKKLLLDREKETTPFGYVKTRILKPELNNERIIAQSGWFTAHRYSRKSKGFVPLENNTDLSDKILEISIPSTSKPVILRRLNIMGINHFSLFPDLAGACSQINWEFDNKLRG